MGTDLLQDALQRILDPTTGAGDPPPGGFLALAGPHGMTSAVLGSRQTIGVDDALPMTVDTAHDLGSVTKVLATTTALMTLVQQGAISRTDPVRQFLPGPPWSARWSDVTLDDLLLHRAGLWEWWPLYLGATGMSAVIERITTLEPRYPPGSRHYSDLGFLLLGEVVARVHGTSLAAAVDDLVLRPWQLLATGYGTPPQAGPIAATATGDGIERRMVDSGDPYPVDARSVDFDGWRERVLVGEVDDGNAYHGCGGTAGHAGLFSTVPDLLAFGGRLLDSLDGEGPLRREVVTAFLTEGPDAGQARGFRLWTSEVDGCEATAYGHPGFPGTSVAVLPRHRATVVLATNRLHVLGEPRAHEPSWQLALAAAHRRLHEQSADLGEPDPVSPRAAAGRAASSMRLVR